MTLPAFLIICSLTSPAASGQALPEAQKVSGDKAFNNPGLLEILSAKTPVRAPRERDAQQEESIVLLDENGVPPGIVELAGPIGLTLTVALKHDSTPDEQSRIKLALERFSTLLWNGTFGNMYVKKAVLRGNSEKGFLILDRLPPQEGGYAYYDKPFVVSVGLLDLGGPANPDIGVRVLASGILHEFGHSMLHLPDEYPYEGEADLPLTACVMDRRSRKNNFCGHCEGLLLERFKKFRVPPQSDRADWAAQNPAPAVIFDDR